MELNRSTLDLLSILIPVVGTVVSTLITAMADVIKTRRQATRAGDQSSAAQSYVSAPPPVMPVAPYRIGTFFRSPIFVSGLAGLAISLGVVFLLHFVATEPPTFFVQKLHINFGQPGDAPEDSETRIEIPQVAHTRGTTQFIKGYDRYLWVFVCKREMGVEKSCTIKRLALTSAGSWNAFVNLGKPEDNCAVFEVGFAAVDREINSRFEDVEPEMRFSKLPHYQLLEFEWFETIRALNKYDDFISCETELSRKVNKGHGIERNT